MICVFMNILTSAADEQPPWFSHQPKGASLRSKDPNGGMLSTSATANDGVRLTSENDPPSVEKDCTHEQAQVVPPAQQSRNQCQPGEIGL